jgi:hypothetical protein
VHNEKSQCKKQNHIQRSFHCAEHLFHVAHSRNRADAMSSSDLKPGDLVSIYYSSDFSTLEVSFDKMGVITEVLGHKSTVLVEGELESWDLSDLKKMAAHKRKAENESR